jgi:hypothetical protein
LQLPLSIKVLGLPFNELLLRNGLCELETLSLRKLELLHLFRNCRFVSLSLGVFFQVSPSFFLLEVRTLCILNHLLDSVVRLKWACEEALVIGSDS